MRKKWYFYVATALLLASFLLVGCSERKTDNEPGPSNPIENNQPTEDEDNKDILQDSGAYVGLIDNNSIEIRISGIQSEEHAYRAFVLSDEVKDNFEKYELNEGDQVQFSYIENEHGQRIIIEIKKI